MTDNYALIGYPLGHSLSPEIHEKLFALSNIKTEYKLIEIRPEELKNRYEYLNSLSGFNVTIPHKISMLDFCFELSEGAKRYGAVNCIKNEGGKSVGYNTDVIGFVRSIEQLGASLNSKVCVLGCGGAGRMMAIEAARHEAELTIAIRPEDYNIALGLKEQITKILPRAKVSVIELKEVSGGYDLIINATPVGMFPKNDFSPLLKEQLENVKYLFDAVYNPAQTLLSKYAVEMGAKASTGMDMLVLQAAAAHEIWNGSAYKKEDIDALIADMRKRV